MCYLFIFRWSFDTCSWLSFKGPFSCKCKKKTKTKMLSAKMDSSSALLKTVELGPNKGDVCRIPATQEMIMTSSLNICPMDIFP